MNISEDKFFASTSPNNEINIYIQIKLITTRSFLKYQLMDDYKNTMKENYRLNLSHSWAFSE